MLNKYQRRFTVFSPPEPEPVRPRNKCFVDECRRNLGAQKSARNTTRQQCLRKSSSLFVSGTTYRNVIIIIYICRIITYILIIIYHIYMNCEDIIIRLIITYNINCLELTKFMYIYTYLAFDVFACVLGYLFLGFYMFKTHLFPRPFFS